MRRTLPFLILAVAGVGLLYALLKMRYGWYTNGSQSTFLTAGFVAGLVGIVALWFVYPSRVAVALLGVGILVFPAILRSDEFVAPDLPFFAYALVPLGLLVGATHLRLRNRPPAA
ncbi:TPA: hypothetical protein UOJ00_002975 [Stenotrophomonas maltophilia]|nr:hypothetical protein [Stenotrophomonas maltophilia]